MDAELDLLAREVGAVLTGAGLCLATAESCTGGWLGQVVTSVAGSSAWFDRGFITYSNAAKQEMLGVRAETLARFGAVSEQAVAEMAEGALTRSGADLSVAISGIAGPGGATADKPVGSVCIGWAARGGNTRVRSERFTGDRTVVRRQAVVAAIRGVLELAQQNASGASGVP